jgi:hypothetical protein
MVSDLGGILPFAPGCVDATTVDAGSVAQACSGEGGFGGQPTGSGGDGGDTGTEPVGGGPAMGGDSSGGATSAR